MELAGSDTSVISWVGFEWEDAVEQAARLGIELEREFTAPPRGRGKGTLRVVRQRQQNGRIICTCAAEEWREAPC